MNKRLTLTLLALPAFALADVRIYGDLKSGVETSQTKFGGKASSYTGVSDLDSHVGIRGSHPIGGGSSVIWQMEQDAPLGRGKNDWQSDRRRKRDGGGESYIGIGR